MASAMDLTSLERDPRLFLYTSLTAGSSHIITATSRMETILKANKIPFQAIDTATDEKARRLWQRRAGQRKLPGLVKEGYVIGDIEEVEEWNEFGELRENIGSVPVGNVVPVGGQVGVSIAPPLLGGSAAAATAQTSVKKGPQPVFDKTKAIQLPGAEEMAARNKAAAASKAAAYDSKNSISSPEVKEESGETAEPVSKAQSSIDHLSAPASQIHSGAATPAPQEEGSAATTATEKDRGSDVVLASSEEVEQVEGQKSLKEAEDEDEDKGGDKDEQEGEDEQEDKQEDKGEDKDGDAATATAGVAGLRVSEEEAKPQEQDTKEPADAGKSNED